MSVKSDGERLSDMGTDALKWADGFMEIFGDRRDDIDSALMLGWFANALQAGNDEGYRKAIDDQDEPTSVLNLLTWAEHRLLDLLGQVANQFQTVLNQSEEEGYTGNSAVREHDWNEIAVEIHHLQSRVMAQAAARAYPDRYRRLGATIPR